MNEELEKLITESGFRFRPGFSGRVMENLGSAVPLKDTSALLTNRIGSLFYWVNIPMAAALLVIMLLFFLNGYRQNKHDMDPTAISEYVYDYYVSSN
jgi:hypothetical protein